MLRRIVLRTSVVLGVVALALTGNAMAHSPNAGAIFVGSDGRARVTNTTDVPWRYMISIELSPGALLWVPEGSCSGALISKRTILTAGHCLYSIDKDEWVPDARVVPGRDGGYEPFGSKTVTSSLLLGSR